MVIQVSQETNNQKVKVQVVESQEIMCPRKAEGNYIKERKYPYRVYDKDKVIKWYEDIGKKVNKCNIKDIVSFLEGNEEGALSQFFYSKEGEDMRGRFLIAQGNLPDGVSGTTDSKKATGSGGRPTTFQEPMEEQKSEPWSTVYGRGQGSRSSTNSRSRTRKTSVDSVGASQGNKRSAGSTEDMDVEDKEAIAKGKKPKNIQVSKQLKSPNQSKKL